MGNILPHIPNDTNSCSTDVRKATFQNNWTINNFSLHRRQVLNSATFSAGRLSSTKWFHRLYTGGQRAGDKKFLRLETVVHSCDADSQLHGIVEVRMAVSVPKVDNSDPPFIRNPFEPPNAANMSTEIRTFQTSGPLKASSVIGTYSLAIEESEIAPTVLANDKLHLRIRLTLIKDLPTFGGTLQITETPSKMATDLSSLFADRKYCDVTIIVGTEQFPAHRAILAARSSVFAAMFEAEMMEATQRQVVIEDIEPEAFNELLRFIYTDDVPNLQQWALMLLPAADKYALDKLKSMCEVSLYENLSLDTAMSTLMLADLHRCEQLKKETINFVGRKWKELSKEELSSVLRSYPELCAHTINELMNLLKI